MILSSYERRADINMTDTKNAVLIDKIETNNQKIETINKICDKFQISNLKYYCFLFLSNKWVINRNFKIFRQLSALRKYTGFLIIAKLYWFDVSI